tara:strand:- start:16359 stop:16547 length:189 start_codon:yes stop_codon:yes gene_type:complete
MTPKEKALELAMQFDKLGETDNAKQCALISVDEIIDALLHHAWQNRNEIEFYEEVKQEIQKL